MHSFLIGLTVCLLLGFSACKPSEPAPADGNIRFSFRFDPNQERLNNLGQPAVLPAGHAAQTPQFRAMSVHYIELASNAYTLLGAGAVVYKAPETTRGGENAIDFDKALVAPEGQSFLEISLENVPPGTYEWIRASVAFQLYDVFFNINGLPIIGNLNDQKAIVASFLGFNTYIGEVKPAEKTLQVNDDKKQGFWVFETDLSAPYNTYNALYSGEAPAGATTVVNPLFNSSPVPPGSCVITGKFAQPLVIAEGDAGTINIILSFSTKQSFEWIDQDGDGKLDLYANGTPNEQIVDMGLRGLIPEWTR